MRRHIVHALSAVAAAGGAAILTLGLAGPAAASTAAARAHAPDPIYTISQAGFVTGGGRWFRYIATTVKVPPVPTPSGNAGYAEVVLGGISVPQYLAVRSGGGPDSVGWSTGVPPFGMGGGALNGVTPKVGDLVRISIYYDRAGHIFFTANDLTQKVSQTFQEPSGAHPVFTAAEVAGVVNNATVTAPKTNTKLQVLSGSKATTYTGVHGTLTGPWTTTEIVDTTTGTASGAMVISPNVLWNNGQNLGVWLRPTA